MAQLTPTLSASPRTLAAYVAVLRLAQRSRVVVSRLKMAKLLYFADLRSLEDGDDPMSGVEWKWLNYGPYNNDLMHLENALVRIEVIKREEYFQGWRLDLFDDSSIDLELEEPELAVLSATVADLGRYAASTLMDMSYQTTPMLIAQEDGVRGVVLDMDSARPVPSIDGTVANMRAFLAGLPEQETDDGAPEELVRESQELDAARRAASATLLGDA